MSHDKDLGVFLYTIYRSRGHGVIGYHVGFAFSLLEVRGSIPRGSILFLFFFFFFNPCVSSVRGLSESRRQIQLPDQPTDPLL